MAAAEVLNAPSRPDPASTAALERLEALRVFVGAPGQFWPEFLQIALALASGTEASLLTRHRAPEDPAQGFWKENFCWPPNAQLFAQLKSEKGELERLTLSAEGDGAGASPAVSFLVVRLVTGDAQRSAVLAMRCKPGTNLAEASTRLRLLADAPLLFQMGRSLEQARADMGRFAVVLDAMVLVNAQTRFMGAAMTLCNELAARYRCDRVSLGWLERGYTRLQALSHTEKFERKMAAAIALEAAMDEALDQDEDLQWPAPPASTAVVRDHEALAQSQGSARVFSLPIRIDAKPLGVLTLERGPAAEWTPSEGQTLRLLCDHAARRLHELKLRDRWFGARFATLVRERAATLLSPEHTGAKLAAICAALALGVLFFGKAEYRVEAPFILKSDTLAQVPAPFDGFLDEVHFRVGDPVEAGQPLLALDTRELLLQEAAAIAERERFSAEAQKAESDGNVADMRIAQASAEEAQARLELSRHHLAQARVLAPFDGFVVEGDLRERLSSPVKQGEVLVKVAKLDALNAELAMPERDVHEIAAGERGEVAFASRPQWSYPIRIERVEPSAEVRETKGNIFITRAQFTGKTEPWWRPGMSGVAKVNAGKRTLWWIVTHRTADFLRLYLWW